VFHLRWSLIAVEKQWSGSFLIEMDARQIEANPESLTWFSALQLPSESDEPRFLLSIEKDEAPFQQVALEIRWLKVEVDPVPSLFDNSE